MVTIEIASNEDCAALAAMREREGWYPNRRLLEVACQLATCRMFVVRDQQRQGDDDAAEVTSRGLVATILAIAYGHRGFIGNVLVLPDARQRGYGRSLMGAGLDWLAQQGVGVVELDATKAGRSLYERLGFAANTHSLELDMSLSGNGQLSDDLRAAMARAGALLDVVPFADSDLLAVAALDRAAFGGSRLELLEHLMAAPGASAFVARAATGVLAGYLVVHPSEPPFHGWQIGPWIATSADAAAGLFGAMVRTRDGRDLLFSANIPGTSEGPIRTMGTWGFTLLRDDVHMRLDLAPELGVESRADWVYTMLSAMVG